MPRRESSFTVRPADGGKLITSLQAENAGHPNYVQKVNWRRVGADAEGFREGDDFFPQRLKTSAKLQLLTECIRPSGIRNIVAATATTIYRFDGSTWNSIGSGFDAAGRWQADDVNGYLVLNNGIDLPVTFRVEDEAVKPIYELREMGVARVGVIVIYNGILQCYDITEIQAAQMATWMNGATPYGFVPEELCNRIRYLTICSEIGNPRQWAPSVSATINSSGNAASLAYPVHADTWTAGTKLAIIGAGPDGSTIGGDEDYPDGVPIATMVGTTLVWTGPASDSELTYPLTVRVMRWTDTSTIVSRQSLQDDSSPVLWAKVLGEYVAVYRETSIYLGRYTGDLTNPFIYRRVYTGPNNLSSKLRRCVVTTNDNTHIFAGDVGFFAFDGSGAPSVFKTLDDAKAAFFASATESDAWAEHNPITNELWFGSGTMVLALDYKYDSAAEIDMPYAAAGYVHQVGASGRMFLLSVQEDDGMWTVVTYGANAAGPTTYHRRGAAFKATIKSGLWSMEDPYNAKDVRGYLPHVVNRLDSIVLVRIYATRDPELTPVLEVDVAMDVEPDIPLLLRDFFFQDEIVVVSPPNMKPALLTARTFEVTRIRTRGMGRVNE